jgi:sensor domain CHASE-containing protein
MRIGKKISLGIAVSFILTIVILYGLLNKVFLQGFGAVEQLDTRHNVERVVRAFHGNIATLKDIMSAWYQWDDSYRYLLGKNPAFVKENITPNTFTTMKINFLFLAKEDASILYKAAYGSSGRPIPIPEEISSLIAPGSILTSHRNHTDIKTGILMAGGKPYIVVSAPVIDSNGNSKIAGTLAVFRSFDSSEIQHLSEVTKLHLAFEPVRSQTPGDSIEVLNSDKLIAHTIIADINGHNALGASIEMPRPVFKQGQTTIRYLLGSLVAMGGLLIALTLILLNRIVIRRTTKLSLEVSQRRDSLDFGTPTTIQGRDEIAVLAQIVNGMMKHVHSIIQKYS